MRHSGRSVRQTRQTVAQRPKETRGQRRPDANALRGEERERARSEVASGDVQPVAYADLAEAGCPADVSGASFQGPPMADDGADVHAGQGLFWCQYVQDRLRHFSQN